MLSKKHYSTVQLHYLHAMGIPAWTSRDEPYSGLTQDTLSPNTSNMTFDQWLLSRHLKPVGDARSGRVSTGPEHSDLLVLLDHLEGGLSAAANRLLDAMLNAIDLSRRTCRVGFLCDFASSSDAQVAGSVPDSVSVGQLLAQSPPRNVLFFTAPACQHAYCEPEKVLQRMPEISLQQVSCQITYHPEYLLSNPHLKRSVWDELKKVHGTLRGLSHSA